MSGSTAGVNAVRSFNVHTIAIQVPIARLTANRLRPRRYQDPAAVIGVWASAHRQKAQYQDEDRSHQTGLFTQVSRLANPLFNEVIVPMAQKDRWNRRAPSGDFDLRARSGGYWVLDERGSDVLRVQVLGGQLATLDLRR